MKRGQTKDGPGFLISILDKQENSQVGLVPSNYLQELSQFLTQDVNSGRNGSEGPVRTFSLLHICLQAGKSFNSLIDSRCQATNGRATNGNGAPNEEIQGKSWYYGPISRGECDAIMDQKGQDGDFLVSWSSHLDTTFQSAKRVFFSIFLIIR